jgi:galactokinase
MSDARVREVFARHFGGTPTVVASASGRVNLIGDHTDYNGGEVLPIAIEQRTYVAARGRADTRTHIVSARELERGSFDSVAPERAGAWWDYAAGVVLELGLAGRPAPPADLAIWSAVPAGAGLGSSAALEIATARAMLALSGQELTNEEVAVAAWRAEVEFVGVGCGIMDQFASALAQEGQALHLWCESARVSHVPMHEEVLIFDTGVGRSLRGSAYADRRAECMMALEMLRASDPGLETLAAATPAALARTVLPPPLDRRVRHVLTEGERVRAVVAALEAGASIPGDVLQASHHSLRDDFECSTAELDWFVERVMGEPGVRGARLTGAGWGGCAIAVGMASALRAAAARLLIEYRRHFGGEGRAWVTRASGRRPMDAGA